MKRGDAVGARRGALPGSGRPGSLACDQHAEQNLQARLDFLNSLLQSTQNETHRDHFRFFQKVVQAKIDGPDQRTPSKDGDSGGHGPSVVAGSQANARVMSTVLGEEDNEVSGGGASREDRDRQVEQSIAATALTSLLAEGGGDGNRVDSVGHADEAPQSSTSTENEETMADFPRRSSRRVGDKAVADPSKERGRTRSSRGPKSAQTPAQSGGTTRSRLKETVKGKVNGKRKAPIVNSARSGGAGPDVVSPQELKQQRTSSKRSARPTRSQSRGPIDGKEVKDNLMVQKLREQHKDPERELKNIQRGREAQQQAQARINQQQANLRSSVDALKRKSRASTPTPNENRRPQSNPPTPRKQLKKSSAMRQVKAPRKCVISTRSNETLKHNQADARAGVERDTMGTSGGVEVEEQHAHDSPGEPNVEPEKQTRERPRAQSQPPPQSREYHNRSTLTRSRNASPERSHRHVHQGHGRRDGQDRRYQRHGSSQRNQGYDPRHQSQRNHSHSQRGHSRYEHNYSHHGGRGGYHDRRGAPPRAYEGGQNYPMYGGEEPRYNGRHERDDRYPPPRHDGNRGFGGNNNHYMHGYDHSQNMHPSQTYQSPPPPQQPYALQQQPYPPQQHYAPGYSQPPMPLPHVQRQGMPPPMHDMNMRPPQQGEYVLPQHHAQGMPGPSHQYGNPSMYVERSSFRSGGPMVPQGQHPPVSSQHVQRQHTHTGVVYDQEPLQQQPADMSVHYSDQGGRVFSRAGNSRPGSPTHSMHTRATSHYDPAEVDSHNRAVSPTTSEYDPDAVNSGSRHASPTGSIVSGTPNMSGGEMPEESHPTDAWGTYVELSVERIYEVPGLSVYDHNDDLMPRIDDGHRCYLPWPVNNDNSRQNAMFFPNRRAGQLVTDAYRDEEQRMRTIGTQNATNDFDNLETPLSPHGHFMPTM